MLPVTMTAGKSGRLLAGRGLHWQGIQLVLHQPSTTNGRAVELSTRHQHDASSCMPIVACISP